MTTPAGYSGTPLHRKLGVREGSRVLVPNAPPGWDLTQLDPDGSARVQRRAAGDAEFDVVLLFAGSVAELIGRLPTAMQRTSTNGRCWVAWRKRQRRPAAAETPSDLDENGVREVALAAGWVDVKVCAVDQIWSGLCLVRRLADR